MLSAAIWTYYLRIPDTTPILWPNMLPKKKPLTMWKYIVIHHSGTAKGSPSGIDRHHREENGWDGIGYHFVIGNGRGMRNGRIEYTFRWDQQREGAHAGGKDKTYNQQGIGICIIGNFDEQKILE
ncbi:MAG: N-acetylmuramoyl-L-alanine amidase, partial [Planctomycetes bacterium]|nr:N-acetylmuramoyl-L-alanine amidase [Planctomycetota bacterium]